MDNINIGNFILEVFDGIIGFFITLYQLITFKITIPSAISDALNNIIGTFGDGYSIPSEISVLALLGAVGVPLAFALGVYYIVKGAI